jgi:hypothetical protein
VKPALWVGLALACGGALAVSWLPDDEPAEALVRTPSSGADLERSTAAQVVAAGKGGTTVAQSASAASVVSSRQAWPDLTADARAAWSPPARPVPPASAPPPLAPPPPFPYQWLGQLQDGGVTRWFIASPQQTLAVAAGDIVEPQWRVEGREGGRLRLTWLPTGASLLLNPR